VSVVEHAASAAAVAGSSEAAGGGEGAGENVSPAAIGAATHVCDTQTPSCLGARDKLVVLEAIKQLSTNGLAIAAANENHCIGVHLWVQVVARLKRQLMGRPAEVFDGELARLHAFVGLCAALAGGGGAAAMEALTTAAMPLVVLTAEVHFNPQLHIMRERRHSADLRQPHTWYPLARSMKRKLIFHAGPTNSGKTYNALLALKGAWSGVYAGPLRLLALEVFESMNLDSVHCSLLTGQERRELPFATHASCTVEMLDVTTRVDVAVIDEIQMIGDEGRGASWTRAVLGVPAPEVHLCGDPAAEPVIRQLAEITGDELEIIHYARMTSINPMKSSLEGDYSKIEAGDAVVAFSRKDIYAIRRLIERKTPLKCCVVYGSLPPETRSAQARLFNDPNSGYRVLVASDAIGMGLNLNIRRVVFHTMSKYNGQTTGPVSPAQVKQIAGRAGRRSSIYPEGFTTTLMPVDVPYLHACMGAPTAPITAAGLFPNAEQLSAFAALLPRGSPLATVINEFTNASQLDGPYFMCRSDDVMATATLLEMYCATLSLEQRAALCLVPAHLRNKEVRAYFLNFMDQYTSGQPVRLQLQLPLNDPNYLVRDLEGLEEKASALDTYLWLAGRLGKSGGSFPSVDEAVQKRAVVSEMLESSLAQLTEDTKEAMTWSARKKWAKREAVSETLESSLAQLTEDTKEAWTAVSTERDRGSSSVHGRHPQHGGGSHRLTRGERGEAPRSVLQPLEEEEEEAEEEDMITGSPRSEVRRQRALANARAEVLQRASDAARQGISERTASRLAREFKREKLGTDAVLRRSSEARKQERRPARGSMLSTAEAALPAQAVLAAAGPA
jgi:ATP-dependent RNA helicase SUPV3L1/SUV3